MTTTTAEGRVIPDRRPPAVGHPVPRAPDSRHLHRESEITSEGFTVPNPVGRPSSKSRSTLAKAAVPDHRPCSPPKAWSEA